eukprot:4306885-Pleurochrysis_carterae.AAC.2
MAHHAKQAGPMHPISLVFRSQELENGFRLRRQTTPVFTGILIFGATAVLAAAFTSIVLGQGPAAIPMIPGIWTTFVQCVIVEQHPLDLALFRHYNHLWGILGIVLMLVISDPSLQGMPSDLTDARATCLRVCMHANGMLTLSCCVIWYTRHAHIAEKIFGTLIIPAFHTLRPQYGLTPNEEMVLFFAYVLVGHCIGYVVELLDRTIFIKQQLQDAELQQLATVNACIDEECRRRACAHTHIIETRAEAYCGS